MIIYTRVMIVMAILSNCFTYLQVYKVWKRQSHDDLSILFVSFHIFSATFWAIYGVILNSMPLIISGSMAAVGYIMLFYMKLTIQSANETELKYI